MGRVYYEREALKSKIEQNTDRVEYMQARLDEKKEMMLQKFYAMEQAMARMQTDANSVASIASNWAQNLGNTSGISAAGA
jgi:flagellar hook-associated protein 2